MEMSSRDYGAKPAILDASFGSIAILTGIDLAQERSAP
jgi:hypothetical protein